MTLKDLYYKTKYILLINLIFILSACSEPDYRLVDGGSGKVDDFLGKWLIVNYWADWCPPCIKEIPELNKLNAKYSDELNVFLFNFDRLEGEELKNQLRKIDAKVPSLVTDPQSIYNFTIPESLPVTFVINKKGELSNILQGPQTLEEMEKVLNL